MSTNSWNTSDGGRLPIEPGPNLRQNLEFLPGGVLDPGILARMANKFFHAAPDANVVPAHTASDLPAETAANSSTPTSVPAMPNEVSLPSDPHLSSVPANAGPAAVAPMTIQYHASPSVVPGVLGSAIPGGGPAGFSFLQYARPIFPSHDASSPDIYPTATPINEFVNPEPAPIESSFTLDDGSLSQASDIVQPPTPTLPGAFGLVDSSAFPAFSFLEEVRPLFSATPSIPGPVPALPELEVPEKTRESSRDVPNRPDPDRGVTPSQATPFGFLRESRPITAPNAGPVQAPSGIEPHVPNERSLSSFPFDAAALKRDFPILRERVHGRPIVWLDNAATTQKPQSVIDRLDYFYEHENSNVHRAAHELAARATDAYESAREKVRRFLNASSSREIVFVRGATEGINLIAQSWGRQNIQKDDEIVITWLEHHANIVPWQMLASEKGARLRVAPVDSTGQILLDEYEKLLGPKTRLVAFPHVSNALGVVTPAHAIIEAAHRHGATVLLDGAQSVSHMRVDAQSLDCDFFVFSGHKVFAPTGIGVVYAKPEILEHMPPWQGGGNMIQDVTFEKTIYQPAPQRFEAGTGNIADAVGLGAAIDYVDRVGMENISRHEHGLLVYATNAVQQIPGLRIIGTAKEKAGVISFVMDGFRTEEIGDYLNRNGIAVRSGHHCAQPILRRFGLESTVRASLALYNTIDDIDALVRALWNLRLGHISIE